MAKKAVFVAVGVTNTAADFAFYTVLTSTVFKGGHDIALAGLISGTFALFFAFMMHSFITWRGAPIRRRTFLKFFLFTGAGMWTLRPALLALFIHLGWLYRFAHQLSHGLHLPFSYNFIANTGAFGFMAAILLVYNFYVYDRFVFTSTSAQPTHTELESH